MAAQCGSRTPSKDFQNRVLVDTRGLMIKNGLVYHNNILFTGYMYRLYPDSKDTMEVLGYREGKEHGIWRRFYQGNKLHEKREFAEGKKVGNLEKWWENGKKQMHYVFVNDEYEGFCREWNREGRLIREMNYQQGHEEGVQRWWYDNGKIKANYIIKNGRRFGLLGTKNCINVSDSIFKK